MRRSQYPRQGGQTKTALRTPTGSCLGKTHWLVQSYLHKGNPRNTCYFGEYNRTNIAFPGSSLATDGNGQQTRIQFLCCISLHPKLHEYHVDQWRKSVRQGQGWLQAHVSRFQYRKWPKKVWNAECHQEKEIIDTNLSTRRERLKMQSAETMVAPPPASPTCPSWKVESISK